SPAGLRLLTGPRHFVQQASIMQFSVQGGGPPLLLLHGIPTSGRLWDRVAPALERRFTCVVVDLPGLGESPPLDDGSLDPARYAAEIELLRRHLRFPSWHIMGHDAGSTVAVHYAAQFHSRVNRLVLCSPPIFPEFRVPWFFRALRAPVLGDFLAPLFTSVVLPLGLRSKIAAAPSRARTIRASCRPFRGLAGGRQFVRLLRWGDPAEVLGRTAALLPRIETPTLVLHGRYDGAISASFAFRAAQFLPHAEARLLDAGHFLPLNCPETLCAHVVPFLEAEQVSLRQAGAST